MTNDEIRAFLRQLDNAEVDVNAWEAEFIASNLTRENFSGKQREIVQKLRDRYGRRIGFD